MTDSVGRDGEAGVEVRPLSAIMGVEVTGLDLSKPLSAPDRALLDHVFNRHMVVCFRDQDLTMDELVAFSKVWGPLTEHTMPGQLRDGITQINIATNKGADGKPSGRHPDLTAMRWHTDRSWRRDPALATILYGVDVPSRGGDTLFVNCALAYDGLPEATRQRIDGMFAIHSVEYSRKTAPEGPAATEYELRNHPPTPHPLARRHPVTGKRALYIGCHAWKIEGLSESEGRELLDGLLEFATQEAYVYAHKWRRHDLLMWDNRCTLHAATPYDTENELRTMYRTVVAGGPTH
ncbi:MAG TPA: TauD/TfdA family dioxygenase [Casimicrobiaceae bacterium]|nr:TauD/TfdA family dioxygenase [Casimicrobiaceae bacterium]